MKVTVNTLQQMAAEGQKIAMLTCYDASFSTLLDEAGVDILLVGDSLGMVMQGEDSTLPVSMPEMEYHTRCVARGAKRAMVLADARALAEAGASLVLMECVPAGLAARISQECGVPTIGIGAGPDVSGQVLVIYDVLGVYPGKKARFVKNFMAEAQSIQGAVAGYVAAVKDGSFPAPEHCF